MSDPVPFDADAPSTWERFSEETPDGGRIVLVRYPEGYRLRYHGETVWREGSAEPAPKVMVEVSVSDGGDLAAYVRNVSAETVRKGIAAYEQTVLQRIDRDPRR